MGQRDGIQCAQFVPKTSQITGLHIRHQAVQRYLLHTLLIETSKRKMSKETSEQTGLSAYQIPLLPESFYYIANFISATEEQYILQKAGNFSGPQTQALLTV